jgi:protease I
MRLSGKKVAILVAEGFEDLEYWFTPMRRQEEGAEVVSVGPNTDPVGGKNALEAQADTTADKVDATELDGVVVPGGWAPDKLRRYPDILDLVKTVNGRNKTVGIICHGGLVAISAGIVDGVSATGSLGIKDDLENAGATWVDKAAFREGNLVWGRVVPDIPDFCRELVAALAE